MKGKTPKARRASAKKPALLAGGNPQIAKADGDAPVQPTSRPCRAGSATSPFYGIAGRGWFLSFHVFTRYVKVTFFQGRSLRPLPPGASKHKEVRYFDIYETPSSTRRRWRRGSGRRPPCPAGPRDEESMKESASELIDKRIAELGDWRGRALSRMRKLIQEADPGVVEEWKWMGPVWSHDGIICTGESYKSTVKLTFAKGAALKDPAKLFNSSLDGNVRRAIDIREGEQVDAAAFKALVRAAVALNASGAKAKPRRSKSRR